MELFFLLALLIVVALIAGAMPMAVNNISTGIRNAMCDAFVDAIDGGAGAGLLEIHTVGFAAKLATLTFTDPAYGAAAAGVAQENTITDDTSADATGTAAVFRVTTSTPTTEFEGTVSDTAGDIVFNSVAFVAGDTVSVTDLPVTMPAA